MALLAVTVVVKFQFTNKVFTPKNVLFKQRNPLAKLIILSIMNTHAYNICVPVHRMLNLKPFLHTEKMMTSNHIIHM